MRWLTPSISFCIMDAIRFVASMTSPPSAVFLMNVSKSMYHGEVETIGGWMLSLLCQLCCINEMVGLPLRSLSGSFRRSDMVSFPLCAILVYSTPDSQSWGRFELVYEWLEISDNWWLSIHSDVMESWNADKIPAYLQHCRKTQSFLSSVVPISKCIWFLTVRPL